MKSIRIKTIALYASIIVAASALIEPIYPDIDSGVYAKERPSDSIPFCEDKNLPIHTFCANMDGQASPRLDGLTEWGSKVAESIITRIDR